MPFVHFASVNKQLLSSNNDRIFAYRPSFVEDD